LATCGSTSRVKLLRALEDTAMTRVGSTTPVKIDFRPVAVINRNRQKLVNDGSFRAYLCYRLAARGPRIRSPEERGAADRIAILQVVHCVDDRCRAARQLPDLPYWHVDAIADTWRAGNVRERRNLAGPSGVTVRQLRRVERITSASSPDVCAQRSTSGGAGRGQGREQPQQVGCERTKPRTGSTESEPPAPPGYGPIRRHQPQDAKGKDEEVSNFRRGTRNA
jgi:transcriptional regulator with PAS, ATPase and Fis domain